MAVEGWVGTKLVVDVLQPIRIQEFVSYKRKKYDANGSFAIET